MSHFYTPARGALALASLSVAAVPLLAQDCTEATCPALAAYAKTFPAMPRETVDLIPYLSSPRDLTFGSGTPFNDLVYTAFETAYMDGETNGFDTFYPVDPARETPGADRVRYVRTTGNIDLDVGYSGSPGDRIVLGTEASALPFFRRGADGEDDDYLVIHNFDYRNGAVELPGEATDYALVYGTEEEGYATAGYYLFYTADAEPDLIAFVFECDDVGLPVSGTMPRDPRALCNGSGALSLSDGRQFRFLPTRPRASRAVLPQGLTQYGTSGKEIVGGIAADAGGNVYAFGSSDASLETGAYVDHAIWVARTNADGSAAWTTEIEIQNGSLLFDGVTDGNFLYVCGRTLGALPGFQNAGRWDAILLKLRLSDGEIVASDQWGNSNLDGYGSICLDDAGHLYVTGAGSPPGQTSTDPDHLVAKHRASDLGNVWRVLDEPDASPVFVSEAWGGVSYHPGDRPGAGTVAAGGWYMTISGSNAFASLWTDLDAAAPTRKAATTLASPGTEADWFLDNAFDAEGNVYYVGYTTGALDGPNAGKGDAIVVKYDENLGNPQIARLGSGEGDQFRRVRVTPRGDVYAVGYTYGDLGGTNPDPSGRSGDVLVARYSTDLELLASTQIGGAGEERGYLDFGGGRLFVGGLTDGALVGPSAGSYDVWAAELDARTLAVGRTSPVVDVAEGIGALDWRVYPNPSAGRARVEVTSGSGHGTIEAYDALGRAVTRVALVGGRGSVTLPAAGVYTVVVEDEDGRRAVTRVVRR